MNTLKKVQIKEHIFVAVIHFHNKLSVKKQGITIAN